jgi:ABC-type amino acid transport system permease subunit
MSDVIWTGIQGTIVLWLVSATLAVLLAVLLTVGVVSSHRLARYPSRALIDLTRGIPTSLIVITAGIATFRFPTTLELPTIFPGTPATLQPLAWTIVIALALGSAGHLAEIFRCSRESLGRARLEEADVLGLPAYRRTGFVAREVAAVALAPTGSRLVHHLHNTAFAALFPVTELFGALQSETSATFRVRDYALLGCVLYAALSLFVWALFRVLETAFFRRSRPARPGVLAPVLSVPGGWPETQIRPVSPDVEIAPIPEGAGR